MKRIGYFLLESFRRCVYPFMPKYDYAEMLHTDDLNCVGYLATNRKAVAYGPHYRWLYYTGRIR